MEEHTKGKVGTNLKSLILWISIAILSIIVIYVFFFNNPSGANVSSIGQAAGQVASSGMVGGC